MGSGSEILSCECRPCDFTLAPALVPAVGGVGAGSNGQSARGFGDATVRERFCGDCGRKRSLRSRLGVESGSFGLRAGARGGEITAVCFGGFFRQEQTHG